MKAPYAVVSMNNDDYKPLAAVTWANKVAYCEKWGYDAVHFPVGERDEFSKANEGSNHFFGFAKIQNVLDTLLTDNYEWVFFSECDAMVTNFDKRLEDIADNRFHALISSCFNGVNAGNFMVRNTLEGRAYLLYILSERSNYRTRGWAEQQVMIDSLDRFKGIVERVPQRTFNSYDELLYQLHNIQHRNDSFGQSGLWQPGDFHVHWPGLNLDQRLKLASEYSAKIVNTPRV